jgi:hypothetical protein
LSLRLLCSCLASCFALFALEIVVFLSCNLLCSLCLWGTGRRSREGGGSKRTG